MSNDIETFLKRTVLDHAFRELALSDPDKAFQGFDLSPEEQDILRSGDERMLNLLGRVLIADWQHSRANSGNEVNSSDTAEIPQNDVSLPLVDLTLRLTPFVSDSEGGRPTYRFAASLHPWPINDQPREDTKHAVDFHIHIVPTIISPPGTAPQVSYAAAIGGHAPSGLETTAPSAVLRRYFGQSQAAERAAAAAMQAKPMERQAKLYELVHALRTGDQVD